MKAFRIAPILVLLAALTSCTVGVVHHSPGVAATKADDAMKAAYLARDVNALHDMLDPPFQQAAPPEKLFQELTTELERRFGKPQSFQAIAVEPGLAYTTVFYEGVHEGAKRSYHRVVLTGTDEHYNVSGMFFVEQPYAAGVTRQVLENRPVLQ